MTEYWLQKKTISGWSVVTWYDNLDQAKLNYDRLKQGVGYSYRLVKVETVECHMLDEVTEVVAPELEQPLKTSWGAVIKPKPSPVQNSGWGATPVAGWGNPIKIINPSPIEGVSTRAPRLDLQGSVWLVHHGKKHKTRVAANLVDGMLAQGYERGSPRTVFK